MKKKILCVIISAVMVVGALAGCGSSSDTSNSNKGKSSKIEQTILTELIPGETTAEETLKWFNDNALVPVTDEVWTPKLVDNNIPAYSKSSDTFLGYKCFYERFSYVDPYGNGKTGNELGLPDDVLTNYVVCVTFKDRDEFKEGKEKIEEYVKSLSETKAVNDYYYKDDKAAMLVKDDEKYATVIVVDTNELAYVSGNGTEGLDTDGCFDTIVSIRYEVYGNEHTSDWELPDGTKFDLKCKDFVQSNQQ